MTPPDKNDAQASSDSLRRDKELEHYKADLAHAGDLFRATTVFEHAALKPLLLLNGGALIAVVALLGALSKDGTNGLASVFDLSHLRWAIGAWAIGLIFGAGAAALGYKSQLAFYKAHNRRLDMFAAQERGDSAAAEQANALLEIFDPQGQQYRQRAEISGWLSIGAFIIGSGLAVFAIT